MNPLVRAGINIVWHSHLLGKIKGIRKQNEDIVIQIIKNKNWHPQICPKCGFEFLIK